MLFLLLLLLTAAWLFHPSCRWGELERLFTYSQPVSEGGLGLFSKAHAFAAVGAPCGTVNSTMATPTMATHEQQHDPNQGASEGSAGRAGRVSVESQCAELLQVLGAGYDRLEADRLLKEDGGSYFMPGPAKFS